MKNFKKLMALVVAMVMIATAMLPMAVSAADKTQKITIAGLEKGDTVKLYKVLGWTDDAADAKTKLAVNGWYWVAPFSNTFNKDANEDDMEDTLYAAVDENNKLQINSELAGDIARALNENGTDRPVDSKQIDGNTYEYKFTEVDEASTVNDGLYVAIVTPEKTDHVYNPIFVHLDSNTTEDSFTVNMDESYTKATKAAKKSEVKVDKDSKSKNDYTDTGKDTTALTGQEATPDAQGDLGKTVKPGDELTFTVKTVIPGYAKIYKKPVFNVSDTMVDLIYQKNVKVYLQDSDGNKGADIAASNYNITKNADDGYKIEFKDTYLQTLTVAQPIILEYTAKVPASVGEEDAANITREKNTVEIEFSHDPSTESDQGNGGDLKHEKDITNHYTFAIDANALWSGNNKDEGPGHSGSEIIKVAVDKDGKPITESHATSVFPGEDGQTTTVNGTLAGAEFMLYYGKDNGSGELVIDEDHPVYTDGNIISDNEGRLNMTGLDAGTYFLKELKAPAGFVKSSDVVRIDIEATFREQTYTEYYDEDGNWFTESAPGLTKYEYKAKELASYTIKYNGETASSHTFNHIEESEKNVAKVSSDVPKVSEMPHSIKNTKGVELPSTGGMGTTLFYVIGAILVIGAGVVLVTKRRMGAN